MSEPAGSAVQRIASGIDGLDTVLFGGFIKNGLYIIQGVPGAGKTILSNQICFAHAAQGGRALYVTLLAEQHEKLLANIENLSFFDRSRVTREIVYISAFQLLEQDGLSGLLTLIRREIIAHGATLLILDGLVAAEAYASSQLELKKFVHELQTLAGAADTTMFLLTSAGVEEDAFGVRPEHTMVDGLISLHDTEHGWRVERDVLVRKLRGSDHLRGRHALAITGDGIKIWPRTESLPLPAARRPRPPRNARLSTGIRGLDLMLGGGLPAGSSTIVMGPPGAGKTAYALSFLGGSSAEAPGLWLGFYETPEQLLARAELLVPALPALARAGHVRFQWHGEAENLIDSVAHGVLEEVRRRRVSRVVIDGLPGFKDMSVQPERLPRFFKAFTDHLRELGATTFCTEELPEAVGPGQGTQLGRLTTLAENLILLRHAEAHGALLRLISILKLRDSGFDTRIRHFTIEQGGVALNATGSEITLGAAATPGSAGPGNAAQGAGGSAVVDPAPGA